MQHIHTAIAKLLSHDESRRVQSEISKRFRLQSALKVLISYNVQTEKYVSEINFRSVLYEISHKYGNMSHLQYNYCSKSLLNHILSVLLQKIILNNLYCTIFTLCILHLIFDLLKYFSFLIIKCNFYEF